MQCPRLGHYDDLETVEAILFHMLTHIIAMEDQMTEFANDQAHLDADVASEGDAITAIEAEIAALKAVPAGTPLDFTALDAAVGRLQGDAPATPPAVGSPSTPAPADGSTPAA